MAQQTKRCKTCGEVKPASAFYKNATLSDGLSSSCKECKRAYQRQWRADNREKHRSYVHQYYQEHKEECQAYRKQWAIENAERKAVSDREWRRTHPKKMRAMRKVQNARRRARLIEAKGDYTPNEWLALKEEYDNTCLACGRSEPEVKITPDHVIPLALGGSNDIDNIQPLCWGCNAAKQDTIVDYR